MKFGTEYAKLALTEWKGVQIRYRQMYRTFENSINMFTAKTDLG